MSIIPSLRDIAEDSENVLDEALMIHATDGNKKFIYVEGGFDRKFLIGRGYSEDKYYYLGMTGKPSVISGYKNYMSGKDYERIDKILFLVDVDYDHVTDNVIAGEKIKYFSYCNIENFHQYNDVEGFLLNSNAFYKFCLDYGVEAKVNDIRNNVELESRRVGKYRAANEYLKKKYGLNKKDTILSKFNIEDYMDDKHFIFLERDFESYQKINSKHKSYIDELFVEASRINSVFCNKWELSRGHDITEFISLYFYYNNIVDLKADEIEKILRIGVENTDFESSIIGLKFKEFIGN